MRDIYRWPFHSYTVDSSPPSERAVQSCQRSLRLQLELRVEHSLPDRWEKVDAFKVFLLTQPSVSHDKGLTKESTVQRPPAARK